MRRAGILFLFAMALCAVPVVPTQEGVGVAASGAEDSVVAPIIACPATFEELFAQVNDSRGCKFVAGRGGEQSPIIKLFNTGNHVYGVPIYFWNGTSLVRVRSGSGHGWYSCRSAPAAGSTTSNRCHLYDNRDGSRNKPLADWLFVGLTKKFNGTAIQSRPLAGPRNRKLYPSTLRGVCVKLQIQTAFIPVMSPKVLVGPPEDKGTGGSGGDKRNGWCVYAEVSPDSEA
eukprot:jgi/Mesvir1/2192/Mv16696-RA.1